jgi:hypothetical protein
MSQGGQPSPLFTLTSQAGVRRDGTDLDSPFYADVTWTRFQRGKPRKIGGYTQLSGQLNAPIRSVYVDARNGQITSHYFGKWGIQRQLLSGVSATGLVDRTPVGFTPSDFLTWSQGVMYSSTGGSYSALITAATPDLLDVTSDVGGSVYAGDVGSTDIFGVISDGSGPISISGGVCVLQPFLVVYGSNGLIRNTNANDYSAATGWSTGTGYANTANVAGTKIIHGAPVRGGSASPAGLFWALDAVIRMSFVGGTKIFQYDTLSQPTSILGKKTVVEVDGRFFWIGTDRFLMYSGVVQELPNQMNVNDFFENLNYAHRNKVWGTKIPRYGEIWWFYPRGTDTECKNAVIYNYVENTWYDAKATRGAGHSVQVFNKPVWAGDEDAQSTIALTIGTTLGTSAATAAGIAVLNFATSPAAAGVAAGQKVSGSTGLPINATVLSVAALTVTLTANCIGSGVATGAALTFTSMTTGFVSGQTATGGASGATGIVVRATAIALNLQNVTGTFNSAETVTGPAGATCKTIAASYSQTLTSVYVHEVNWDKILGQNAYAIPASFTTCNFGLAVGSPFGDAPQTLDVKTRVLRMEPDFDQTGDMIVTVNGKSYANQAYSVQDQQTFGVNTNFVDLRAQERIVQMQVSSNTLGGFFQLGQVLMKLAPGDERGNG